MGMQRMKRIAVSVLSAVALYGAAVTAAAAVPRAAPKAAGHVPFVLSLTSARPLLIGTALVSPNHAYSLVVQADGALVEYRGHRVIQVVHAADRHRSAARLALGSNGDLVELVRSTVIWRSYTAGAGAAARLTVTNDGVLRLDASYGLVWMAPAANGCVANTAAQAILVSVGQQLATVCSGSEQLLLTPVTTGASALGDGTPLGSYRINAKVQNTHLYPAAGGVYAVRYWLPYLGNTYGIHDSSWQSFPYGSMQYQTEGSHGCIHLPRPALDWFFSWVQVGTVVSVSN